MIRWLALLVVLIAAPAAHAQFKGPVFPWFPTETDRYVVDDEFKRMPPTAGVITSTEYQGGFRWKVVHRMSLFAMTTTGISSRTWDSDARDWTIWEHLGNPTGAPMQKIDSKGTKPGFDTSFPILRGWFPYSNEWVGYFGFRKPSTTMNPPGFTGMPSLAARSASMLWEEDVPTDAAGNLIRTTGVGVQFLDPATDFRPASGINRYASGAPYHHVFGTGLPLGYVKANRFAGVDKPLIELRRDFQANQDRWIVHGAPAEENAVDVGSAVSVIHDFETSRDERHYVFVGVNPREDLAYGDGVNDPEVFYRTSTDGQNWSWGSLGAPDGVNNIYGPPVAAKYYDALPAAGGKGRVVVYVTARQGQGDWELWQQYHNGTSWQGWTKVGQPPSIGGRKFKLTSAVVWYEGTPNTWNALRINFFGYSEEYNGTPRHLVEWRWNGSYWGFGPSRQAPDGRDLRTLSSAVIDQGSTDRVVVFTRSDTGRIWEFSREHSGGGFSERWEDLSWEPLFRLVP